MDAKPYHHGGLRAALLAAAEQILEREGPDGLTLRAIARAAGVSHAAPAHHFGDLRGLLTALAASGFQGFARALKEAGGAPGSPLAELGRAYVRFARSHPGLFLLMFRSTALNAEDSTLNSAKSESFAVLSRIAASGAEIGADASPRPRALASWCLVHGFAMLMLDGRLPSGAEIDALLDEVLAAD